MAVFRRLAAIAAGLASDSRAVFHTAMSAGHGARTRSFALVALAVAIVAGPVLAGSAPNYRAAPTLACLKAKKVIAFYAEKPKGALATVDFSFVFEATANPGRGALSFMRSAAQAARLKSQWDAEYRRAAHRKPERWRVTLRRNVVLYVDAPLNAYELRTVDRCLARSVPA